MRGRAVASVLGLASVLVLGPAALAGAEFRGTDMWANIAPRGPGGLADQHPLSYYALDFHVDGPSVGLGGVSTGDIPAMVGQFLASIIFTIVTFFMRVAISAFDWAFNIDVIGGRHGALAPVGSATQHLYASTFAPLLKVAILVFGAWVLYKVASRRFGEAGAGALRAVCLTAIAIAIIFNPGATIGKAASLSKDLGAAIVSGSTGGNGGQDVSDRLFQTFIYHPWAVLEFGGLKRCVSKATDENGFPANANLVGDDDAPKICRSVLRSSDGHGGYAPAFLRHAPGSDERDQLYKDIKDGEGDYDKADAPAVDMMQAGGTFQRLAFVGLLSVGIVAAILLLGLICFAALFTQLGLLVMLAATPMMVIAGVIPALHGVFWTWLRWIGKLLVAMVVYSLMLSAALGVSAALMWAGGEGTGYMIAFTLQAVLFLGLFVKRKALAEQLTSRREINNSEKSTKSFVGGAATAAVGAVSAPVGAAVAAKQRISGKQEAAPNPDNAPRDSKPNTPVTQSTDQPSTGRRLPADSSSPPASAGRDHSPNPVAQEAAGEESSAPVATMAGQQTGDEPVPTREFKDDLAQAREQAKPKDYGQQRTPPPMDPIEHDPHGVHNGARAASLSEQVKQERAKTPSS